MTITLAAGDRQRLEELARKENDAKQRDRYRAVLLAAEDREGDQIARNLGRSPRFVDQWLARYRRGGIDNLQPKKQPGRKRKLTAEQEQWLMDRLDAGPTPGDGVCTLRGKDICHILKEQFGVVHTLSGLYDVLQRLGYSSLSPRPRHRKNEAAAMEQFKQSAPLLPGR
jgi:transposase